jgi:hypothetical protein
MDIIHKIKPTLCEETKIAKTTCFISFHNIRAQNMLQQQIIYNYFIHYSQPNTIIISQYYLITQCLIKGARIGIFSVKAD